MVNDEAAVMDEHGNLPGYGYHPDHDLYLRSLGQATFQAARLAGTCFDILRVWHNVDSSDLYNDPLGKLENKLRGLLKVKPDLPRVSEFLEALVPARNTRNDLMHALPVHNGLHRRNSKDLSYVRSFYTLKSLDDATAELVAANHLGVDVLYNDGGAAVSAWYNADWADPANSEVLVDDGRSEQPGG